MIGHKIHYIETYHTNNRQHYRLSEVKYDEYLKLVFSLIRELENINEIEQQFLKAYPQVENAEFKEYIKTLLNESLLFIDLKLPITSSQPDAEFIQSLEKNLNGDMGETLQGVISQLKYCDENSDKNISCYKSLYAALTTLPYPVKENALVQVDTLREFKNANLSKHLAHSLFPCVLALKSITHNKYTGFSQFIKVFQQRFEGRLMPLLEVLNDEVGIPYSLESNVKAPLLSGLGVSGKKSNSASGPADFWGAKFIDHLSEKDSVSVLRLSVDDLLKHQDRTDIASQLPASFGAMVSLYQDEHQQPIIHLHHFAGPSAANLLGRFCHLDDDLLKNVREHLQQEESLSPDVIFAEIIHLPNGRVGNVISRPALRDYEIVFLADTLISHDKQIPISDLHVYIEAGIVKLWSKKLKARIIPRLSCAHNYASRSLGIYRFLCSLQKQEGIVPNMNFPNTIAHAVRTPRVQLDNVILSEAKWRIERKELAGLVKDGVWQEEVWRTLYTKYTLDRYVTYAVSDNELVIDLHNPIMLNLLLTETKRQHTIEIKESLKMKYRSMVQGDEGDYANEVIIPFLNPGAKPMTTWMTSAKLIDGVVERRFHPGSEWLSIKLYAPRSTAETLLLETLYPRVMQFKEESLFKKWFFIRYSDPDWHIRLRFNGEPSLLYGELLPRLTKSIEHLVQAQQIHKIELFTYDREVERYGGPKLIENAEEWFMYDSEAILKGLNQLSTQGELFRIRLAAQLIDTTLRVFNFDERQKLNFISQLREGFAIEFQENARLRKRLGAKYREYQKHISQDLSNLNDSQAQVPPDDMALQELKIEFESNITPLVDRFKQLINEEQATLKVNELLSSILHMTNNRLFKTYGREQEFVMYDFMRRIYLSNQARSESNQ